MKEKNSQKGFIKTPVFISVIVGLIIVGGISYYGYFQLKSYQTQQTQREKQNQELFLEQQEMLEEARKTLEESKIEIEKAKIENQKKDQEMTGLEEELTTEKSKPKENFTIQPSELSPYLGGVTEVSCIGGEGSGFLMDLDIGYVVITNNHVVNGTGDCAVTPENNLEQMVGHYNLDRSTIYRWNSYTDIAILKMTISAASSSWSEPIKDLNYSLSSLRLCPYKMPEGSPMVIVGYPAFAKRQIEFQGTTGQISSKQVTNGIISGYDRSVEVTGNLPYSNYYVSAKIDSGNSGGVALSKDENGLCFLGVPTWLNIGNYEVQGIVQNIHNVYYKD
ncbi:trypsin-like peptidase domain-containing protein [Patescibacteria group bacterium]|nr:trypsin-like peptidase domain-containing protein [Patescibacteria group bacterium]MBU4367696.1 trypsin-like peptidase domain-containing protein [Patescibacteria group bacterium]MBU4461854.1 trypsin-like peptidase domain-containing protein [Patescibacteria group bacterium]MCG2700015.1 trypsin-like peptidase domain-containing protein [Candidatus Parcubacteria bacterium]